MDILFLSKRIFLHDEDDLVHGGIVVTTDGKVRKILRSPEAVNSFMYGTESESIIDFGNKVIMPGLIDSNVHINEPGRKEWEGFVTATKSAAAGGFTTIVDMPLNCIPPTTNKNNLSLKTAIARGKMYVDVAFWGGLVPNNIDDIWGLIRAGVVGIKCFLCPSGDSEFPEVDQDIMETALKKMEGTGSVLAFHAELLPSEIIVGDENQPKKYRNYLQTRNASMELNAIKIIAKLATKYKTKTHILNLSSAEALPIIAECKKNGGNLSVETCHHYLTISAENIEDGHTEFKCTPPIREKANQDKLWDGIRKKDIDLIVSDHSPSTPGMKCLTYGKGRGDFLRAKSGIASLQFGLSIFWTHCQEHGLGIRDVYRLLCRNPAKLCGIDHIKGRIQEGCDADFCIWDPDEKFTVSPEMIYFQNKANPYMGQKLRGTVHATVVRGLHVFQRYEGFGQPLGKIILRKADRKIVKFT